MGHGGKVLPVQTADTEKEIKTRARMTITTKASTSTK